MPAFRDDGQLGVLSPEPDGTLYARIAEMLTSAGFYAPANGAEGVRLADFREHVVINWLAAVPAPGPGVSRALRVALVEMLTAAGLAVRDEPNTGSLTVARVPAQLPAVRA